MEATYANQKSCRCAINQKKKGEFLSMYNDIPSIITFNECKDILKVGKNTLLDLLHSNTIQGFKIGNRWKIPKESVVEFIRFA